MKRIITTTAVAVLAVASLGACAAVPGVGWKSDVRASVEASTSPDPEMCESMQWLGVESGEDMAVMFGLTPDAVEQVNDIGPLSAESAGFGEADDFDFTSVPEDKYGDAMLYALDVVYEITCS